MMASVDRTALRCDGISQARRSTAAMARELIRADLLAKDAFARHEWDRVLFWEQRREEIREERSALLRSQMVLG